MERSGIGYVLIKRATLKEWKNPIRNAKVMKASAFAIRASSTIDIKIQQFLSGGLQALEQHVRDSRD